ncbi:hypothetical protein [Mycobacterium phage WXIN]|nr:hypothetical protein [Mycobacterium phage WXIN]
MSTRDQLAEEASLMTAGPPAPPPPCTHPAEYRTVIAPWQTRWNGAEPITRSEWQCELCHERWTTTLVDGFPPSSDCGHPQERWIQVTPWERDLASLWLASSGWACGICDARWIERRAW